jgi:hypothetical protein
MWIFVVAVLIVIGTSSLPQRSKDFALQQDRISPITKKS